METVSIKDHQRPFVGVDRINELPLGSHSRDAKLNPFDIEYRIDDAGDHVVSMSLCEGADQQKLIKICDSNSQHFMRFELT